MTKEELQKYCYFPRKCRIGTLWFSANSKFFLNYDEDTQVAKFYFMDDDTTCQGKVSTPEELAQMEKLYYVRLKDDLEKRLDKVNDIIHEYEDGKRPFQNDVTEAQAKRFQEIVEALRLTCTK